MQLVATLYKLFIEKDVSLLEINPLIVTADGDLKCLDCKMNFDSNALYRHPDVGRSCATRPRRTPRNWPPRSSI